MGFKRKQYIIDKKFQLKISFKAVAISLITVFIIGSVLFYFAKINNNYTNEIVKNQEQLIEMFLTTPDLQKAGNQVGEQTFKKNISMLVEIKKNSEIVLYFIVIMIIVQSLIIFAIFISITHKISGPIYVMSNYLREVREGIIPKPRPLRKKDELKSFHEELRETIDYLISEKNKK